MPPHPDSDAQLVKNIKLNNSLASASLKELSERHSGLFHKILNIYVPATSPVCNREELALEKIYLLYSSALKFDQTKKVKFSTFFGNEVKWLCLNCYNKQTREQKYKSDIPVQLLSTPAINGDNHFIQKDSLKKVFELISNYPDKRIYTIFNLRYNGGNGNKLMSWRMVSKEVNLSIQGCINVHNAALKQLKNTLKKENNE